ncbi:MAG: 50S ribosomal protein L13 [Bacteroidetes bacterium]|nr:50S ribosomal protein L13 [Bacteroidota bacterium]
METSPKTRFFKKDEVEKKWYVVDAAGQTLGRLASRVARVLRGKHKPSFTPNADVGDFVIVINAEKVQLTGKRAELKQLYHNTGYPGGARFEYVKDLLKTHPEKVIEHAVKGMLPHNRLGKRIGLKLKVYRGTEHPHTAQKPEQLTI